MIELSILDEQNLIAVDEVLEDLLMSLLEASMASEGHAFEGEVSLVFCDDAYIKALNKSHRNIDKKTDVLSFPQYDQLCKNPTKDPFVYLGDVVISTETASEQALEFGHSLNREIGFLFVHSLFHLFGYDHDTHEHQQEMRAKEEGVLNTCQLTR